MATKPKIIGMRLRRTRIALGYAQQVDFAREIGLDRSSYHPFESGKRRITIEISVKIKERWNIPLDWIYCGDPAQLPAGLYEKIGQIRAAA